MKIVKCTGSAVVGGRRTRQVVLGSLAALCLSGCGIITNLYGDGVLFGGGHKIEFRRISEDLNNNYPVAVELIVVYNRDLESELAELTARQWFDSREQYLRDFSKADLETFRWEWTPGQTASTQDFRYRRGARAALVFASYASPGEHRVIVDAPNRSLKVTLNDNDFVVDTS